MRNQTVWWQNEIFLKRFLFETLQFYHTSLYILISWSSELNLSIFHSQMKIVRVENQHDDFEKDFIVIHCLREEFDIQKSILICFEFRTLFDLKNRETSIIKRCFRCLNKTIKIKFELRMLLHLCLKKK